MQYIPKKTIYDITQDELEFLYLHCQKIKEEAAKLYNHNLILQGENEYLKKQLKDLKSGNNNKTRK
jgi:regulator of replication initiation timing